jgi:hypothetical protein
MDRALVAVGFRQYADGRFFMEPFQWGVALFSSIDLYFIVSGWRPQQSVKVCTNSAMDTAAWPGWGCALATLLPHGMILLIDKFLS